MRTSKSRNKHVAKTPWNKVALFFCMARSQKLGAWAPNHQYVNKSLFWFTERSCFEKSNCIT